MISRLDYDVELHADDSYDDHMESLFETTVQELRDLVSLTRMEHASFDRCQVGCNDIIRIRIESL